MKDPKLARGVFSDSGMNGYAKTVHMRKIANAYKTPLRQLDTAALATFFYKLKFMKFDGYDFKK